MIDYTALAYALLLGVVAAFNPCGFALLPAYITVLVTGTADARLARAEALRRAILFGLAMTVGFTTVFTAFGLLFGAVSLALQAYVLPYVSYLTVAVGLAVIVLGVVMVVRAELSVPGLRLSGSAPRRTWWSQVLYGATFAIASLSCTIGLFLVVVAQALTASSPIGAVAPFVVYAIGMGTSVVIVSVLAALVGSTIAGALRRRTPLLMRIGGVLMVLSGLYVVSYGLAELLVQSGNYALESVLTVSGRLQGDLTGAIQSLGTPVLLVLVGATAVVVAVLFVRRARR